MTNALLLGADGTALHSSDQYKSIKSYKFYILFCKEWHSGLLVLA